MVKVKNNWNIVCNHTPEVIDRIIMPIRKRGISISSLNYRQKGDKGACNLEFEAAELDSMRIYKNMLRITDILEIEMA